MQIQGYSWAWVWCIAIGIASSPVVAGQQGAYASGASSSQTPQAGSLPTKVQTTGSSSATTNVDSVDVKTGHAVASAVELPAVVPAGRPAVGLALEGGGALGLAHVGLLKWFDDHQIPVDRLSGTSMGVLVGALYAADLSASEIEKIAESKAFLNVFTLQTAYDDLSYRRREDRRALPQALKFGLKGGPTEQLRNAVTRKQIQPAV